MMKAAASPALASVPTGKDLGRTRFLEHIAQFQRKRFEMPKGVRKPDTLFTLFEKAGISKQELAQFQADRIEQTRAVAKSFIESLKTRNLDSMRAFKNTAYLTNDVDYAGKGRLIQLKSVVVHSWDAVPFDAPVPPPQFFPPDAVYKIVTYMQEAPEVAMHGFLIASTTTMNNHR